MAITIRETMTVAILLDPPGRLIDTDGLEAAARRAEGMGRTVKQNPVTITREAGGVVVRGRLGTVNAIQRAFVDPQSALFRSFVRPIPDGSPAPKEAPAAPTVQRRKIRLED